MQVLLMLLTDGGLFAMHLEYALKIIMNRIQKVGKLGKK